MERSKKQKNNSSTRIDIRCPNTIFEQIESLNLNNRTEWIVDAIKEKLGREKKDNT